jgi:choloylglycine hydrolase
MCTGLRFSDSNGDMYFGRNLDWTTDYGQRVILTPRNFEYQSAFLGKMSPRCGALIGMGIVVDGVPLYFDCANENGLAVAGLNFPGLAKFEDSAVEGKTNVAQYEFPLWVCLNFSTVDEVKEALNNTAIVAKPINDKFPASELHYLIGDKNHSIVVEYTEKGMQVFEDEVDVLTNAPGFLEQLENLTDDVAKIPGGWTPPERFVRVAYLNKKYPTKSSEDENVLRLFHILSGVSMIEGAVPKQNGFEKTLYTGGYSVVSGTYYYNTYDDPTVVHVSMDDYDLDGAELIEA